MHAFVTGASGFLGEALVHLLRARRHAVTAFDANITDMRNYAGVEADVVFHLASDRAIAQGRETYREIDIGGAATLRAAFPDTTHFIYASTIWVYGSAARLIDENEALSPTTNVGRVKLEVEEYFRHAPHHTIFRFGMIYPGRAFHRHFLAPAYHRFFLVPGPGENYTGLVSLDDAVMALASAAERSVYGIYNFVDDTPLRWRRLFEIVHDTLGGTRPRAMPPWLVRLALGDDIARFLNADLPVSNRKAKDAGFVLKDSDFATGLSRAKLAKLI